VAEEQTDQPLSPEDARVMIGSDDAQVVDIRDDEDAFADGHVAGAVHIPGGDSQPLPDDFSEDKTIVLVCEDGKQSAELASSWREDGRTVTSVEGGMNAWRNSGMPVQPGSRAEFEGPDLRPPGT
jgi:rhodanese-related sulfurtransferase